MPRGWVQDEAVANRVLDRMPSGMCSLAIVILFHIFFLFFCYFKNLYVPASTLRGSKMYQEEKTQTRKPSPCPPPSTFRLWVTPNKNPHSLCPASVLRGPSGSGGYGNPERYQVPGVFCLHISRFDSLVSHTMPGMVSNPVFTHLFSSFFLPDTFSTLSKCWRARSNSDLFASLEISLATP